MPVGLSRKQCHLELSSHGWQRIDHRLGRKPSSKHSLADRVVVGISDVQVAAAVHRDVFRIVKPRVAPGPIRTGVNACRSGQRRHHPIRPNRPRLPDCVVAAVRHIDVGPLVHRHTGGRTEPCVAIRPVRAARAARLPGQRRDHPIRANRRHFPDCVVAFVRHIDVARAVHRHAGRRIELRVAIRPVRAARNACRSDQRRHHPIRANQCHLPDRAQVRHVDIARAVHRHAGGRIEPRVAICPVGEAKTACHSRQRRHHPIRAHRCHHRRHLPDGAVVFVRHIDVARGIHRHAGGRIEPRVAIRPVRAAGTARLSGQRRHHPIRANQRHVPDRVVVFVRHIDVAPAVHGHALRAIKLRVAGHAIGGAWLGGSRPSADGVRRAVIGLRPRRQSQTGQGCREQRPTALTPQGLQAGRPDDNPRVHDRCYSHGVLLLWAAKCKP